MLPRMGFLLHDPEFDEEKYRKGWIKFMFRKSTEGIGMTTIQAIQYKLISCWETFSSGWEEIELTEEISNKLNLHYSLLEDLRARRRKIMMKK